MTPGELLVEPGFIELNGGRATFACAVANSGDRPIQVGSHYHFYETNDALIFEREATRGFRLNIASGTAVRFEPGQTRTVELVALSGDRRVFGFAGRVMGTLAAVGGSALCADSFAGTKPKESAHSADPPQAIQSP